ncbi:MAG: acyltransferase [Clostridia bacterium]|nr:acyltransferase [Clostridia bacterium]
MSRENTFTIKHTNIVKGIAILMLLWHHLFSSNPNTFDRYVSVFWIKGIPVEVFIGGFCKVCVAIFMFLSGYGLFKSYTAFSQKEKGIKKDSSFIKNRWLKLMSPFWFVYVVFVPLSLFFGTSFLEVYGKNPFHYIADFFGLSYLFYGNTYTMNETWWYMSIIIVLTLLFPLIVKGYKKFPELAVFISIAVCIILPSLKIKDFSVWICPLVIGVFFAHKQLFEKISGVFDTTLKQVLIITVSFILFFYIRMTTSMYTVKVDFLFMLPFILTGFFIIPKIPFIRTVLEQLGKKSGLIFLFHTFIFSKYFQKFTYSFKYSVLIYIIFLAVCVAVAFALDGLMRLTRYQKLFDYLTRSKATKKD